MARRKKPTYDEQIDAAIRAAGTIGALEHLAGVGRSQEEREDFWMAFRTLPASQSLDAGVAELKRRIRARASAKVAP